MRVVLGRDVAVGAYAVEGGADVGVAVAEHGAQFLERPDVVSALALLAVGVGGGGVGILGGVEAAVRGGEGRAGEVGGQVVDGAEHLRVVRQEEGVEVDVQQLGLVGEHLLEVRQAPVGGDGVAGEAVPDLVAEAAAGHLAQGGDGHGGRVGAFVLADDVFDGVGPLAESEEEGELRRGGEFGGEAEAAVDFVVLQFEVLVGFFEEFDLETFALDLFAELVTVDAFFGELLQFFGDLFRVASALLLLCLPDVS